MNTALATAPAVDVPGRPGAVWTWIRTAADTALVWLIGFGEASSAARAAETFQRLIRLSDADLAARGLTRAGLVEHCFGHLTNR